jgi:luciferase family oxidoreductase group 1
VAVPLSIVDSSGPDHLAPLVTELDQCGFHRYWATEHYSRGQSASPVLLAALAAGLTKRMRVGTAGVLLRMCSALRVASDFAALESYFPGRIDLGIAGAVPPSDYADLAALDVRIADDATFEDRIVRLLALLDPVSSPVGPPRDTTSEVWICGSSLRSATIAARLGLRFAFHQYIARNTPAAVAANAYRSGFVPRAADSRPYFAVAAFGACAATSARATSTWRAHFGREDCPEPTFFGEPAGCVDQLAALRESCDADEVAVDVLTHDFEARIEGLTLLSKAWH